MLNTNGVNAVLDDGNEAVFYVSLGDGATSADEVSNERRLVTLGAPSGGVISATNAPLNFTGTPSGSVTHALLFSTSTVGTGTFYGAEAITGDGAFNGSGAYSLTGLTITGSPS